MNQPYLKVKKLRDEAKVPSKREEDAAYDIYGIIENDFEILKPGEIKLMPSGIAVQVPKDWVFFLTERGSTGSKGLARRCGVIDSGFRGEVFTCLNNTSNKSIVFIKNSEEGLEDFLASKNLQKDNVTLYSMSKAVSQAMVLHVPHIEVEEVDELDDNSKRGEGKLGSSGK